MVPSGEVRIVPDAPTAINNPLDVVEEESSDDLHDEIKVVILTTRTNQYNILFILFLYRKCCKIKTTNLYVTSIGLFYKNVGGLWSCV